MQYYEVAPTQIIRSNSSVFTYVSTDILKIGQIVTIEVGKKTMIGVITKQVEQPSYDTKPIVGVIEERPLPPQLITLAEWLSSYYATHLALVLQSILPRGIQKSRRVRQQAIPVTTRSRTKIVFNKTQLAAIQQIDGASPGTLLLHGITGSGKTAVYINLAEKTLESGKSVIVLVPEIALTPQIVDEFSAHFDDVILTHSRQTEAERHLAWRDALISKKPRVVIGPRSALFMPLDSVGLIVIDEAHEPSFKQEQSPRYSALRAASILATQHKAKLILGSATPSTNDYYMAKNSHRPIIEMNSTARPAVSPVITLVDMTKRDNFHRHRFLSDALLSQLEQTFTNGKQALVFHNRRGSASTTLCENCGWQATCTRCFVPLTLHADHHELRCHICGNNEKVPTSCPICQHTDIIHKGIGTKLIESELRKIFPKITIGRFDGDSEADQSLDAQYKNIYDGSIDLIIGTQVVAKGLDLPHLRTVGVVQADAGLSLPDYAASERTFQLLAQVVGRVGRSDHPTTVVVQSYQPTHPAVVDGLSQNYAAFYDKTITERKRATFPPFTFLLKLTCIYKTETAAIRNAQILARTLRQKFPGIVDVLGPTPAFYERQRDTYRWQLVLKSKSRAALVSAINEIPASHWQFELDPISLL
jgi:primosomal protein N' (replication factor Y)